MMNWLKRRTYRQLVTMLIILVIAVVALSRAAVSYGSCAWYGKQTDRATRYAAFVGCMVQVEDRWIPRNELRIVQ